MPRSTSRPKPTFIQLPLPLLFHFETCTDDGQEKPNEHFERLFDKATALNWRIVWTRNRSTMISYRTDRTPPQLRIHNMFQQAPDKLIEQIAAVVERRRKKWPAALNTFINRHIAQARKQAPPKKRHVQQHPQGQQYDLKPIFDELNRRYFDNSIDAGLTWMSVGLSRRRRSIKLGSYSEDQNLIRMHPVLDHKRVPAYVVESILYHEMIHAHIKSEVVNGRHIRHGRRFKQWMNRYPRYEEAERWLKKNQRFLMGRRK